MVVVRSSEVSLWRADQPERMRPIIAPPVPLSDSPSAMPPSPRLNSRSAQPELPGRQNAPRGDIFAAQIAPAGDRLYLLGDLGRLKIWTLASNDGDGPIEARQLEPAEKLPEEFTSLCLAPRRYAPGHGRSAGQCHAP